MNKLKLKDLIFELTTSGVFVLGLIYFGGYYLINGNLPGCIMNFNISIPIVLFALSAFAGNIKAIINKYARFG